MDSDQEIINILKELVQSAHYEHRGRSISSMGYRNAWKSPMSYFSREWVSANVVRPNGFGDLTAALRLMLQPFIELRDEKEIVHTFIQLITASFYTPTTLERFAEQVLTSAVLIGPDRTVALLRAWASGEPIAYTRFIVLSGLRIESDNHQFQVENGLPIQSLPKNQIELLALGAPEMWVGSPMSMMSAPLGAPSIAGAPALVLEVTEGPVFSRSEPPEFKFVASEPLTQFDFVKANVHTPLFAGLSLACNSLVSPSCAWSRFADDVQSFVPQTRLRPKQVILLGYDHGYPRNSSALTSETLIRAIDIARGIAEEGLGNRTRTALGRWAKSMQGQLEDQFIDLRIALEAVYAPDGGAGGISYRVQTRCARHMANTYDYRKVIACEIKDFYNTASGFAHGSSVASDNHPLVSKQKRQLERAREICRDALIDIIMNNKGSDIDVDRITLA